MSVWVDSGSRYESEKTNGAANFLGSCAFKGKTAAAIDSIGGIFSATAGREQTVYTAKVFKGDVAKAMEILADSLQAAPEDALINKQRDVLLAKAAATSFDQNIFEHLHETAFMGTGLGQPVFGSEANVKSFSKADLAAYIAGNHTADRVVVAAAGAVDHKQIAELTEKHFGKMAAAPAGSVAAFDPAVFTGSDKRIRFDSMGVSRPQSSHHRHITAMFDGASHPTRPTYTFTHILMTGDFYYSGRGVLLCVVERGRRQDRED